MSREEAINHLKDILTEATETEHAVCYVTNEDAEALEMAIEALQQPERKKCNGCIHLGHGYKMPCTSCARNMQLQDRWAKE